MKSVLKQWWFWIVSISFITYYPAIDNFFSWDDFLWLYRAKTFLLNPAQIFKIDTFYFDPLVHLSFWVNFKLFGLDYRWYHIVDITIHAINGLLLYRFVKLYSGDDVTALFSSLVFASTFAASDAVLWPSSRVDLLSTLFSLATMILFLRYIREGKTALYTASVATYALALSAKGTPVVIPVLLLWLYIMGMRDAARRYGVFIPFAVITLLYLVLLRLAMGDNGALSRDIFHLNIYNYSLSMAYLFVPELVLSKWNLTYTFFSIYGTLFLLWLIKLPQEANRIRSLGLLMTFLFLTPVLILGNFVLALQDSPVYYLLGSPSHRIYLASVGMSIFMASLLVRVYEKMAFRVRPLIQPLVPVIMLIIVVGFNSYETWQREKVWGFASEGIKDELYRLKGAKVALEEGSTVGLVNFQMPEGFLWPMLKVYYDLKEVTVIPLNSVPTKLPEGPISPDGNYALFVKGKKEVHDLSKPFNEMLLNAYRYQNSRNAAERESYSREYNVQAINLNQAILNIDSQ